ncbi:GDP-fucose protein O-fucosyltransferase 2-like isoform X2 [Orbicella faveolata]|uniref:GDP-fucose protein O-fucosyltransferase 2-like isoform X1 n=1 Tax=Orbicella faveolata TaxID=48498 RepID=UPI0009E631D8|nr:GDP-fucose protein O-fucosyltransferase 2-like isoform X1 [Orbicella faveolata]XP_020601527.1 GDP-fucose protein O-fucosyltransferase 2-like isoform X2 [Orbicella faveolata]
MAVEWKLFPVFFLVLSHRSAVFSEDLDDDYIAFEPSSQHGLNVDSLQANNGTQSHSKRYLLYDVNPGEGFNLRRDVYMRVANMMKLLREKQNWVLVVPPWRKLYHWRSPIEQNALPWRTFFDLESLNRYVPVIEFEDFVKETGEPALDEILYLQGYAEGWKDGHWEEKIDDRDCIDRPVYHKDEDGLYRGYFWGMDDVFARKFKCLSVQGTAAILVPTLLEKTKSRSVFVDRFEEVLHIIYGEKDYWEARRSLVFAKHLREEGDKFRREVLKSDDERDATVMDADWTKNQKKEGTAKGGPYLAVHMRRADFLYAHPDGVPSLDNAVKQIKEILKKEKLKMVFLATDADKEGDSLTLLAANYSLISRSVQNSFSHGNTNMLSSK